LVEPGAPSEVSHLLQRKFLDLFEYLRGMLLEAFSVDALVNIGGVSLLMGKGPSQHPSLWEPFSWAYVGKDKMVNLMCILDN
jgi:hypothetical protein